MQQSPFVRHLFASPSTRRAWIEILRGIHQLRWHSVALHTEGVD